MFDELLREMVGLTVDHYTAVIAVELGCHAVSHGVRVVSSAVKSRRRQKDAAEEDAWGSPFLMGRGGPLLC